MHHIDSNIIHREKAGWERLKNTACCFKQILEAELHKTAAVWPPTSHLTNQPDKQDMLSLAGKGRLKSYATFSYGLQHMGTQDS